MAKMDPNAADAALAVWNGTRAGRQKTCTSVTPRRAIYRAGWQGRAPLSSCQKQVVFMYVFLYIFSRSGLSTVVYAATKDLLNLINKV